MANVEVKNSLAQKIDDWRHKYRDDPRVKAWLERNPWPAFLNDDPLLWAYMKMPKRTLNSPRYLAGL